MKPNGENERLKRGYLRYLKEARRYSDASVDKAAAALDCFELFNKRRPFAKFHIEQAIAFKNGLAGQLKPATSKPLSKATQLQVLRAVREFFIWLAGRPGHRSRLSYSDADYFSLSMKDTAVAKVSRDVRGPTIEQVRHVIQGMPAETDIECRNRALLALAILTGARDNALASLRLKHLDLREGKIDQDAREVRTKASKTIITYFFPVGDELVRIVEDWVLFLQRERLWGPDDPLFPATRIAVGSNRQFGAVGLDRKCWSTAAPIRRIFREAFEAAGLPYFNPHSLRHTLTRLGMERCQTPEALKAWSQNLGHSEVMTTLMSYGEVDRVRQRDVVRSLAAPAPSAALDIDSDMLREFAEFLRTRQRR